MKYIHIIFITCVLFSVGCDSLVEVDEDDLFSQKFLGKSYCNTVPLFIYEYKHEKHPDVLGLLIKRPFQNERTLGRHKQLLSEFRGGGPDEVYLLDENSRLTIKKIVFRSAPYHIGVTSEYEALVSIDGLKFRNKYVSINSFFSGSLLRPSAHDEVVDSEFLVKCNSER
jgi:hypothetical protein